MERFSQSIALRHFYETTTTKKIVCVASPKVAELNWEPTRFRQFRQSQFEHYLSTVNVDCESIFIIVNSLNELRERRCEMNIGKRHNGKRHNGKRQQRKEAQRKQGIPNVINKNLLHSFDSQSLESELGSILKNNALSANNPSFGIIRVNNEKSHQWLPQLRRQKDGMC